MAIEMCCVYMPKNENTTIIKKFSWGAKEQSNVIDIELDLNT